MIRAVNGQIAIVPFPKGKTVEKKMVGGIAAIAQNLDLVSAKVLFGSYEYPPGSTVYFPGNAVAQHWTKTRHTLNGVEFLLAPENAIVLIEQPDYNHSGLEMGQSKP